jgi:hypothetical protein
MPITIKGIRLESVTLEREDRTGKLELKSAAYSLLSSTDHILANQNIGGYGNKITVSASPETLQALDKFVESYKKDLTNTLGLEEQ